MCKNVNSQFIKAIIAVVLFIGGFSMPASAQRVALTSDAVDWLMCSANIGMDIRLSHRVTVGVSLSGNPIKSMFGRSDLRLANFRIEPNVRYWFNRPMARHFVGVSMLGGVYDLKYKRHHYKGDVFGIGAHYGYAWVLSRQWNISVAAGCVLGYVHGYRMHAPGYDGSINHKKFIPMPDVSVTFSYILK